MHVFIGQLLILVGAFFYVVAGLGVIRMPDLFTRMSASTKASTLGSSFTLLGVAFHFADPAVTTRALATIAFLFLTAPVASHMIGRGGYLSKVALWKGTIANELKGRYDPQTHRLGSEGGEDPAAKNIDGED